MTEQPVIQNPNDVAFGEFKGMVLTKLDDIKSELSVIHERVDKRDSRISKLEAKVENIDAERKMLKWLVGIGAVLLAALTQIDIGNFFNQ